MDDRVVSELPAFLALRKVGDAPLTGSGPAPSRLIRDAESALDDDVLQSLRQAVGSTRVPTLSAVPSRVWTMLFTLDMVVLTKTNLATYFAEQEATAVTSVALDDATVTAVTSQRIFLDTERSDD